MANNVITEKPITGPSQINGSTRVGAGHDGRTQVIPRASGDNATTPTTASVSGQTPVFQAYKHN